MLNLAPFLRLLCAAFAVSATPAFALVLDWTGKSWTADPTKTANSNTYETDGTRAGADIIITTSDTWTELGTPAVNQSLQGGNAGLTTALVFTPNLTRDTHSFTVTITFNTTYTNGVSNVSFSLFDIDMGGTWEDQVRSISATRVDGSTIAPTITGVGPAITTSGTAANPVLTGNALSSDTGAGSGNGSALFSFNADGIRTISFTFGEPTGGPGDPSMQNLGLSNITYSPVPEMNPAIGAAGICAIAIASFWLRRRK